jgi:hypothetical protein
MYLVNSRLLKSSKLTIDHLEVGKLKRNFHLGPPNDAIININNVLLHLMIQQIDIIYYQ